MSILGSENTDLGWRIGQVEHRIERERHEPVGILRHGLDVGRLKEPGQPGAASAAKWRHHARVKRALATISGLLGVGPSVPGTAFAIPGPDTTAVVANRSLPPSVALAERYAEARSIPAGQVCRLDLPDTETLGFEAFEARLLGPLLECLSGSGAADRIEALLLVRGVPLRVTLPDRGEGTQRASVAAALGVARSRLASGDRLLDRSPGRRAMCGNSPCVAARWPNPYREGRFGPEWTRSSDGIVHRPWLVTMLHGRSYEDAALLVASATTAESPGVRPAKRIMLMAGADPARGVLDGQHFLVAVELGRLGFDVPRVGFDADLEGERLSGFITGSARIGRTIEGNRFEPGAVVDNLTSFGAVPENFRESGEERQVSVARWVAQGVAGVHGTTDEPLNNCFPNRQFLVDWASGLTLAEAYHRNLPYTYWRNLVLGDPMAAVWAERPTVAWLELEPGAVIEGSAFVEVRAEATDPVASMTLYADGAEVGRSDADTLRVCVDVPDAGEVVLLAVAETAGEATVAAKGWARISVQAAPGPSGCPGEEPDAGMPDLAEPDASLPDIGEADAGVIDTGTADAGAAAPDGGGEPPAPEEVGCRCLGHGRDRLHRGGWLALAVLWIRRRRRPTPAHPAGR